MEDSAQQRKLRGGTHTRKHRKKIRSHEYSSGVTIHCLHEWYVEVVEKLGWMILSKNNKISCYKNELKILKSEIEQKINQVENQDKKTDMRIMHGNLCFLMDHVNKDFK